MEGGAASNPPEPRLVAAIAKASSILLFTGAGVSTASGIPDFRGPQGVWNRRRPVYYQEFLSSEEARVEYWEYKLESWSVLSSARPNDVHVAAVELERAGKLAMLVTQNVDGLHGRAGTSRERLVEMHGTDGEVECQTCHERSPPGGWFEVFRATRRCPRCPCGGFLKPATISFGQDLQPETMARAFGAAEAADLVIALGSTLSVTPAALVPLRAAERGVPYVIINRGPTDHDGHPSVVLRLEGDVTGLFPQAVRTALRDAV